jgi:hypothetical protein
VTSGRRLIQNRKFLLATLVFCIYEALASWNGMGRQAPTTYSLITIFVGASVTIICVLVVVRTTFIGDRAVIGPITIASLLWVVIDTARPDQQTVHLLREIVWLMWVISLIGGVFVLIRYPKGWPSGSGSPHRNQS